MKREMEPHKRDVSFVMGVKESCLSLVDGEMSSFAELFCIYTQPDVVGHDEQCMKGDRGTTQLHLATVPL